jgi:hypothetical protein
VGGWVGVCVCMCIFLCVYACECVREGGRERECVCVGSSHNVRIITHCSVSLFRTAACAYTHTHTHTHTHTNTPYIVRVEPYPHTLPPTPYSGTVVLSPSVSPCFVSLPSVRLPVCESAGQQLFSALDALIQNPLTPVSECVCVVCVCVGVCVCIRVLEGVTHPKPTDPLPCYLSIPNTSFEHIGT